jgi:hypothetical protein
MSTTKAKYTPSVNIIRDNTVLDNYIPTRNAIHAFNSILNDSKTGVKSHLIIGSYGTGKSSFLLAFEQTLNGKKNHFKFSEKKYEFINLVGSYNSFESQLLKKLGLNSKSSTSELFKELDKQVSLLKKSKKGLAIVVDEFGKYLEYSAKNNPESELYFIQQLAEWTNNSDEETLFITTLHQDFNAYALNLSKHQKLEWDKVKGRIKDIPFNEPVEQLLYLASERIAENFRNKEIDKNFDKLFDCIKSAKAFPLKDYFEKEFAKKLYPFDILSASILTLSLQKYGQNERSLFSFIESRDHLGINEFDYKQFGYYSIPRVYDYLLNGYYSFLTTKYNPDYNQWHAIRRAIERIEGLFTDSVTHKNAENIIKVIGLLNIFANASAKLDPHFYKEYCKYSLGIKNVDEILSDLEKKKIIRYVGHSLKYILFEGTDLDIEIAIDDAGRLVEKVTNVVNQLNQYFEFPFISAKQSYYEHGTPRFFQFKLSDKPLNIIPEGEVDGFINLIFSEDNNIDESIKTHSKNCEEAILFGVYKNTSKIKNSLFEIQKINKVKENNRDDKVALRELDSILQHHINLLNHYVLDNIYSDTNDIIWYFQGRQVKISDRKSFNQKLSHICDTVYHATPDFKNELLNKTKVSGQISVARRKLFEKILNNLDENNLSFSSEEFPPEKSIYLTLLKKTGIHKLTNGVGILKKPNDETFEKLWKAGEQFLDTTKHKERNLGEFLSILSNRPFKLKQGFLDFWVPLFLVSKSDEFALFENGNYVPEINPDILDLIYKRPALFNVKAFDVVGIKLELFNRYRVFLNQSENSKPNNKAFIQTIKPFLVFYKELPEYAKKTNRLKSKTISLRKVIANAKDPEKAFFEDFPVALGYNTQELQDKNKLVQEFINHLQQSIKELRTCYDGLIDRFEAYFVKDILSIKKEFPAYRGDIIKRFEGLKYHLLQPHQKTFINRIKSELDDRKAWLSSIAQTVLSKPLTTITDEEEVILFDKINEILFELDNLSEISKEKINDSQEEVFKLEITSFVHGLTKNTLRIPKEKIKEYDEQVKKVSSILGKDKKINIAILTKLLHELIKND